MVPALLAAVLLAVPPAVPDSAQSSVDLCVSTAGVRAVWAEGQDLVRSALIDASGAISEVLPVHAASGATVASPHVACSDRDCLVVWLESAQSSTRIAARFIDSTSEPFTIASRGARSIDDVSLAWTGSDYFVAWSGGGLAQSPAGIRAGGAARVTEAGAVLDVAVDPSLQSSWSSLDVTSIGTDALIAWSQWDHQSDGRTVTRIQIARASSPLDVITVTFAKTGNTGNISMIYVRDPRLACDERDCVLTWTVQNGPGRGSETHAERFAATLGDVPPAAWCGPAGSLVTALPSTQNIIHSLPLWDGARFRIISAVFGVEERVVRGEDFAPGMQIAPMHINWLPPLSVDAAVLTARIHVVAYIKSSLYGADPRLYLLLIDDPVQRRHAVRH